jgi:phosphatidylglycerophosphate synthase
MPDSPLTNQEPSPSWPLLALALAALVAALAVLLAAIDGSPYLSLSSLSPWIVIFAIAAFGALFAVPFAANERLVATRPERAEAWERALLVWGGVALTTLALGAVLILAGPFSPSESLADAVGILLVVEAGMVMLVLLAWVLAG